MRDGMLHLGRSMVVRLAIPWLVPLEALAAIAAALGELMARSPAR